MGATMTNAALEEVTGQAIAKLCRPVETEATKFLLAAGPILDRLKRLQAIENEIIAARLDADELSDLLDAVAAAAERRYGDHAHDFIAQLNVAKESLVDIEPPCDKPDEMTLAKEAAEREAGR